jgi:predicted aspartyl protease
MYVTSSYGLDVILNGKHRNMQIDTGASGIVLSPAAAKRLGLTPEYQLKAGGVGDQGEVDSYLTHVASIQIGDVQISNCMVEVLQKADLEADGLIGVDVFDKWLVTLDYPQKELRLSPLPPLPGQPAATIDGDPALTDRYIAPEMKDWLHTVRIGHHLLIPSRINEGKTRYLLADTGASMTTFATAFAKEAGPLSPNYTTHFRGLSGDVKQVYELRNAVLRFGPLSFSIKLTYPVFDITYLSHSDGVEVSGFVGLSTLAHVTTSIDYRDNLIQFKADAKHDPYLFNTPF